LVEVGILRGTGLAVWCDLFPRGRVIGLDIDLTHFKNNSSEIIRRGGFGANKPEVCEFDQLDCYTSELANILNGDLIDICIDDGLHTENAILNTFRTIFPLLNEQFCYLIEDNLNSDVIVSRAYPELDVHKYGQLTIIER
jgi:hypothetical protein